MSDVWIFDTSALIDIKHDVPERWHADLLEELTDRVEDGTLCFPRQVTAELTARARDDFLATWVKRVNRSVRHHYSPPESALREVLRRHPKLADQRKKRDDADPFVVAQALAIKREGLTVTVVTRDLIDRLPHTISIATACDDLKIDHVRLIRFLDQIGFDPFAD